MPFLLSAHFSYKQQGVKAVCPAFTHRNNFYRDQALLQWCARQNGLIEGDGRTPMNDRDMGKQRKSVFFLAMRLFNLISTISTCFYKRFKIHWFLSGVDWNQVVWYSLHQDVAHGSNIFTAIVWMMNCRCNVSTGVVTIRISPSAKPNSGVRGSTVIFLVTYDTDSCFAVVIWRL